MSLQTVRALAFLGIFTSHCEATKLGMWGVSVFFILSGFVMFYAYSDRQLDTSFRFGISFSKNKLKKLYPLHIFMSIAALVLVLKTSFSDFSIEHLVLYIIEILLNITLLQSWVPSPTIYFSLNRVAWYLSACLFIYAMFPNILKQIKRLDCKKSLLLAGTIYALQIITGTLSQFIHIPIVYFDNFPRWFTYIFPLFRLGDFAIGCYIGNVYLNKKFDLNKTVATVLECAVLAAILLSEYIFVNQAGIMSREWYRYTILFTPTSVCLILLFAINKGMISKLLTCKVFVYLGNISAYTFLIHQVVIRYIDTICKKIMGNTINVYLKTIIVLPLTILCAEVYMRFEKSVCRYLNIKDQSRDGKIKTAKENINF